MFVPSRPDLALRQADLALPPAVHSRVTIAVSLPTGVVSGCFVSPSAEHADPVPDDPPRSVNVSAGLAMFEDDPIVVPGANRVIGTNGAPNPRLDLVVANDGETDNLAIRAGTAAPPGSVTFPSPATGDVVLAAVYVPSGVERITAAMIVPGALLEQEATGHLIWRNIEQVTTGGQAHRTIAPGTPVGRIDEQGNLWSGTNEFISQPDQILKGQMPDFLYSVAAERFFTHSVRLADLGDPADLNFVSFGPEGLGDWGDDGLNDAYLMGSPGVPGARHIGQVRMTPVRHPYKGYVGFAADALTDVCTAPAHGRSTGDKLWLHELRTATGASILPRQWVYLRDVATGTFKLAATPGGTAIDIPQNGSGVLLWPGVRGIPFSVSDGLFTSTQHGLGGGARLVCRENPPPPLVFGGYYFARGPDLTANTFRVSEVQGGPPIAVENGSGVFDVVVDNARDEDSGVIIALETAADDLPRQLTDASDGADRTAASQITVRLARVGYDEAEDVMEFNQHGELELGLGAVGTEGNVVTIGGYAGRNAVQRIVKTGDEDITGGTFTLYYYGPPPQAPGFHEPINSIAERETGSLSFEATAQQIEDALELIPEIGPNNVEVTGTQLPTGPITIEFRNELRNTNLTRLGITTDLTPSTDAGLRVVSAQRGHPPDSAKPLLQVRDEGTVQTAPRTAPFVEVRDRDNDAVMEVSHAGGLNVQPETTRHVGAGLGFSDILRLQAPNLWWRLGEQFGTEAVDSSASGEGTGTYAGGFTLGQEGAISGDPNTAVLFDGINGRVHTSSYVPWTNDTVRSLSGWAHRDTQTTVDSIFGGSVSASPGLRIDSGGGNVLFRPSDNVGSAGNEASWPGAWPGTLQWVHWALIFDERNDTVELFINGVSKGIITGITGQYNASPGDLRIGTRSGTNAPFDGNMDEFAVWERALTPAEIGIQHTAGKAPRGEIVLGQGADTSLARTGPGFVKLNDVLHLSERAADPAAPESNDVYIYAKDNGSGKTGLYARFASGAVQEIVAEP